MNIPQQEHGERRSGFKLVLMLILGIVIGFGASWMWLSRPDLFNRGAAPADKVADETDEGATVDTTPKPTTPTTPVVSTTENFVNVKDQGAGESVFLSLVSLTKDGWVAVRDVNEDGSAGNILGAARFDAGETQGIIPLLRATEAGKTYRVVLFFDDGDGGFDHTKDALVVDSDGTERGYDFEAYITE